MNVLSIASKILGTNVISLSMPYTWRVKVLVACGARGTPMLVSLGDGILIGRGVWQSVETATHANGNEYMPDVDAGE